MMQACIFNIQRYSLHDGGGIRTIVFFKGCHCRCPWCCNPESLSTKPQLFYKKSLCMNCSKKINGMCETDAKDCPTGAKEIVGEMKSIDEVFDIVQRDRVFYESSGGGVTLSGGEFLLQIDFAIELLKKCKEEHIHTAVETTMSLPIARLEELVKYVDLFLVDFKIMDLQKSREILYLDVLQMKENVRSILAMNGKVIPRIPLIPTYTATPDNVREVIKSVKELNLTEVHLLPFHQLGANKYASIAMEYTCEALTPLRDEEVHQIEGMFHKEGIQTIVHGT